jgi:hypothetical protein
MTDDSATPILKSRIPGTTPTTMRDMPLFQEGPSRRAWRREVAEHIVTRLDEEGELRFIGSRPEDRREMLKIAGLLPDDVVAELYEDPAYPGMTFMEVRLVTERSRGRSPLRMTYPEGGREEAV